MSKEKLGMWSINVEHDEMEKAVRDFLLDAVIEAEECDAPKEVVDALTLCIKWFGIPNDIH